MGKGWVGGGLAILLSTAYASNGVEFSVDIALSNKSSQYSCGMSIFVKSWLLSRISSNKAEISCLEQSTSNKLLQKVPSPPSKIGVSSVLALCAFGNSQLGAASLILFWEVLGFVFWNNPALRDQDRHRKFFIVAEGEPFALDCRGDLTKWESVVSQLLICFQGFNWPRFYIGGSKRFEEKKGRFLL
jgi:hypothetical protein